MTNPLNRLTQNLNLDSQARREPLIGHMKEKGRAGYDCASCEGVCCTFVANSMQITPLEAVELAAFLDQEGRLTQTMIDGLNNNVKKFRLNVEPPSNGKRDYVRRTYTCPFFNAGPKGCSISRSAKPYGCLGFNPNGKGLIIGGNCGLDSALMTAREETFCTDESRLNAELSEELSLDWDKLPIPLALLEILSQLDMIQAGELV